MFVFFIVVGVMIGLTPFFSRQSTPFGVTVAGKHDFVEERKKKHAVWNITSSLLISLPFFYFPFMDNAERAEFLLGIYTGIGFGIQLLFSIFTYLKFRSEILKWVQDSPQSEHQHVKEIVIDLHYHDKINSRSQWSFFIWQLVIILIPVLIAFVFYDRIPDHIPIQYDGQFKVSRSISKNIGGVLALPVIQLLMIPVLNYSHYAIIKSKQKLSPLDPIAASEKSRRFREAWSNATFALTIGTQLLMSFIFLYSLFANGAMPWLLTVITIGFTLFSLAVPLYLTVKYGQAGEKLLREEEQYYMDPEEESHWKYGVFYFNKEDPSVFVEKRFGIGTTLNHANWKAWLFIGGIALFVILTLVWSLLLT